MDDLERKKTLVVNEKYEEKRPSLKRIPLQKLQNIFLHILLFQNILKNISFYEEKKLTILE